MQIIAQDFPVARNRRNSRLAKIASLVLLASALAVLIVSQINPTYSELAAFSLILGVPAVCLRLGVFFGWSKTADELRKLHSRR